MRGARAPGQRFARFVAQAVFPHQQGQRAGRAAVDEQPGGGLHGGKGAHDGQRVIVMNAALVALLVAGGGKAAQRLQQGSGGGRFAVFSGFSRGGRVGKVGFGERGQQRVPAGFGLAGLHGVQPLGGQPFGAGQLRRFRRQRLVPERAQRQQALVSRGGQVVGAGDLPGQRGLAAFFMRHQRQVDGLAIDGKDVLAQADAARAPCGVFSGQVALVAHGAHGLLLRGLQARGQVIGRHGRAQAAQLGHLLAQLGQQGVGGKVAVHLRHVGKAGHAARHAVQNAARRVGQGLGAALARVQQTLAARAQGFVNGFALGGNVGQKVFLLGKARLNVFQLRQQAGERLVAFFGRVGQLQRVFHGLAEQLELRAKFGPLLGRAQRAAALAGLGAQTVDVGIQPRDAVQDGGALHGVAARQQADLLAEQVQPGRLRVQPGQHVAHLRGAGRLRQLLGQLRQRLLLRGKGFFAAQKLQGALAHALLLGGQLLRHAVDARHIGIAQLAQRVHLALALAQLLQRVHEIGGLAPHLRGQLAQQLARFRFGGVQCARRAGADGLHFLELGQRGLRRLLDGVQVLRGLAGLWRVQPEVGIARALALADEVFIRRARGHLLAHRAGNAVQVGNAAHQIGIAHAAIKARAVPPRLAAGVFLRGKRRLPQLHGVYARGLALRGLKNQHPPVIKPGKTVGHNRRGQPLFNQVVCKQGVMRNIQMRNIGVALA